MDKPALNQTLHRARAYYAGRPGERPGTLDETANSRRSPRARRRRLDTPARQRAVLLLLNQKCCTVADACRATDVAKSTFYAWVKTDKKFADAVKQYYEDIVDLRIKNGAFRWVEIVHG